MPSIGDLMFAFAQWLKTTYLAELALWIGDTPLSAAINTNEWFAPVVQTIHILAIAATFLAVQMISFRIFGLAGRSQTLPETVKRYGRLVWWGLVVLLLTGLFLIISEPARELLNPAFWSKMILIVVGVLVCLGFQQSVLRHADRWQVSPQGTVAVRAGAVGVILLWCVIIVLGRWIAYAPV